MNLHEYQAKRLLSEVGIPVPKSIVIERLDQVSSAFAELGGGTCVAKVQVHAGGRGKSGGVKLVHQLSEAEAFVRQHLGQRLVTYQTTAEGQPVDAILLEAPCAIERELYCSLLLDRASRRLVMMASSAGGMDIEKVAEERPSELHRMVVHPTLGLMPYQIREVGFKMGLDLKQIAAFQKIAEGLLALYEHYDFSLIEINPLVIDASGALICLDGKINVDDNALYRQTKIQSLRDTGQEEPRELKAKDKDLSYIALDGNIGCMVNGAGLAMATMDLIKLHGGDPANFLDVGGTADEARVMAAFQIILEDPNVSAILVNIFGGIVRCDVIAQGIISAVKHASIKVPVVVRLEGNQSREAGALLESSGLKIQAISSLSEATQAVVAAARGA